MKVGHTYGNKWPEKVVQRSFIKGHSFPNSLYEIKTVEKKIINTK